MFRLIILFVALVAGGAAAWVAFAMLGQPATPVVVQEAPPPATREVLVAATDLVPGQALTKENVRWQSWPEGVALPAHIDRVARPDAITGLVGSVVRGS